MQLAWDCDCILLVELCSLCSCDVRESHAQPSVQVGCVGKLANHFESVATFMYSEPMSAANTS